MVSPSPTMLTPEEAAEIARCSVKTVRRAYATGALIAYRRRGSRAVLLDHQDVVDWVQGQIVQAANQPAAAKKPEAQQQNRRSGRRTVRNASIDGANQPRFDLSAQGIRDRRDAKAAPHRQGLDS